MNYYLLFSLFIFLAGFVIGLGAVTVIDILGFLARKSPYWTQTTIRTHKVTKVLIWLGISLTIIGAFLFYSHFPFNKIVLFHIISIIFLIINGLFLSFKVSPYLLKKEKEKKDRELLPISWQVKISLSFIVSFLIWWSNLFLLSYFLIICFRYGHLSV
jgi:hypothetical protein